MGIKNQTVILYQQITVWGVRPVEWGSQTTRTGTRSSRLQNCQQASLLQHVLGGCDDSAVRGEGTPTCKKEGNLVFKLNGELLHRGQGKNNTIVIVNYNHNSTGELDVQLCNTDSLEGVHLPRIEKTGGAIHGDNWTQMCKENRCHWRQLKVEQTKVSQWATQEGTNGGTPAIYPHSPIEYRNSMCPTGQALSHPAVGLLTK